MWIWKLNSPKNKQSNFFPQKNLQYIREEEIHSKLKKNYILYIHWGSRYVVICLQIMISSNHDILWFSSILWLFIPGQLWGRLFKLPPLGVPGLHSGVRLRKLCEDGYQTVLNIYHPTGRNVPVRSYRIPGETKQKIHQCYRKNKTVRNLFKDSMNILFDDLEPSFWCCTSCCIQQ